jgi:hypothetical protein
MKHLCADLIQDSLQVDALRSLDWQAKGTVPDELGEWAETTADTECGGVVKSLFEAVVVE